MDATRAAIVGTAGHVFFELGAGVGMPGASLVGPVPAAVGWAAATVALWRGVEGRPALAEAVDGVALAATVAHLAAWPRSRSLPPWLADCEGLGPELMPAYNAILYGSGAAAVAGLVRRGSRRGLLPLVGVPVLMAIQHWEHGRHREQARTRPGWWNRRLRRRATSR